MINVTKTQLPPFKAYMSLLGELWKSAWVTNNGKMVQELEEKLCEYLKTENIVAVANGTLALQLVIKAYELKGEVITTPFTFVATTNALLWEGLTPVFCDIELDTFNIDPTKIEGMITERTSAILAVHVYGNPCKCEELERIAAKHKLKLIFDAAHAFGVCYKNKQVVNYGDASILSFHATKTFHTIEGGAIITRDKLIFEKLMLYRNFGIKSEEETPTFGINAKMNEFQAAMGLLNFSSVERDTAKRKKLYDAYKYQLKKKITFQDLNASKYNYSYMPVVFKNMRTRNLVYAKLLNNNIKARKYFYPLTCDLPYTKEFKKDRLLNAEKISNGVLCLPIYSSLSAHDIRRISKIINSSI